MVVDGVRREVEQSARLAVGVAVGDHAGDAPFGVGEAVPPRHGAAAAARSTAGPDAVAAHPGAQPSRVAFGAAEVVLAQRGAKVLARRAPRRRPRAGPRRRPRAPRPAPRPRGSAGSPGSGPRHHGRGRLGRGRRRRPRPARPSLCAASCSAIAVTAAPSRAAPPATASRTSQAPAAGCSTRIEGDRDRLSYTSASSSRAWFAPSRASATRAVTQVGQVQPTSGHRDDGGSRKRRHAPRRLLDLSAQQRQLREGREHEDGVRAGRVCRHQPPRILGVVGRHGDVAQTKGEAGPVRERHGPRGSPERGASTARS